MAQVSLGFFPPTGLSLLPTLCETFKWRAVSTWRRLERVDRAKQNRTKVAAREETLTESNLIIVEELHNNHVVVEQFGAQVEGHETGADWEWWIVDRARRKLLGLRIQAKKMDAGLSKYGRIEAKQLGLLEASAASVGALPFYCFYGYWRSPAVPWSCPGYAEGDPLQGCILTPSVFIKNIVSSRLWRGKPVQNASIRATAIAPHSVPWHELVCPGVLGADVPGTQASDMVESAKSVLQGTGAFSDDELAERSVSQAPAYVLRMLERAPPTERPSRLPPIVMVISADELPPVRGGG
jgi:hypothetical protein